MEKPGADVWKADTLVRTFLDGVRGGIPLAEEQIDIMLRVLAARGAPVRRFLDLGAGAGAVAAAVIGRHPEAEGVLVDFSAPMLKEASRGFGMSGHKMVFADLSDAGWLDQLGQEEPFDAVVSGYAIHHLTDDRKRSLYEEIFELLAPSGIFLNIEHVAPATPWVSAISDELFVDSLFAYHQRRGTGKTRDQVATEFVYRPDKQANILAPVDLQCAWLREIGFADVDCYFKVLELAVFGGRRPA
jgi:ubiquinone/menaquinone biosynthesis C-methylase UbiE